MRDAVRRCDAMRRFQTKYPTEVAPRKTLLQPVAQRRNVAQRRTF